MEISAVKRRVKTVIERSKARAGERRTRADAAQREYPSFLSGIAVPLFRQVAGVLKAEGYAFTVFTPSGGVRLMSDKNADDLIELSLDTSGDQPAVVGHVKRSRGRRVMESERAISDGPIAQISEDQLLDFLITELEPFVDR